jgi:glutaredoxin
MDFNWKVNAFPVIGYNSKMSDKHRKFSFKWLFTVVVIIALMGLMFGNGLISMLSNSGKGDGSKILYYSLACSYCENVSNYIESNGIIGILEKEISVDSTNANELYERMVQCGKDVSAGIPIPVLWADGQCFVGEIEAVDYLKTLKNEETENVN